MGLTGLLLRAGAARPHVLLAAMPGGTAARLAAEEQLRRRGWPAALSPADADVLLGAGTPAAGITGAVEAAWAAIPAPRARAGAARPGDVAAALDAARAELASGPRQRLAAAAGAGARPGSQVRGDGQGASGHAMDGRQREHDMADGHIAGGHEAGGHMAGGHRGSRDGSHQGHAIGDMEMPAGLPMARRGADRDGLKLDRLHVPLGPVLPEWPAGLVLRLTLQGDVIQFAEASAVGLAGDGASFWDGPWRRAAAGEPVTTGEAARWRAAAHLDSLGRFLAVAGWGCAVAAARVLRDGMLSGTPASALRPGVRRLAARVARSRVLAWSTRDVGVLRPDDAVAAGVRGPALRAGGDVTARYRRWCGELVEVTAALGDGTPLDAAALEPPRGLLGGALAPSAALVAVLPRLLEGAEFAAARLVVASLDPDSDELPAPVGNRHGD